MLTRAAGAAGIITAAAWCGPGLAPHWPAAARALGIPTTRRQRDGIAITFDDGPHPEGTPAVLEQLDKAGRTATFFLVGEQVDRDKALAGEIAQAGHEIAVHGYRHRNSMRLTPTAFRDDLARATQSIADATAREPHLYRPPYGIFTLPALSIVREASLEPLLWSKWGRDWRARTNAAEIARRATRDLRAGDVVLLHDADWYGATGSHRRTAAALPAIFGAIASAGLQVVTAA